jgi:hypothetical protein
MSLQSSAMGWGSDMSESTIYSAVAKAMGEIKRVSKDNRNAEQKYDFASIDDFMAMVGPICAANGLVTIMDEDAREFIEKPGKYGPTNWVLITYQITTYHASGQHLPTVRRHVEVIRSGPQAYGAAQSYVLKQYYRGLLAIPTGDKDDPDHGTVQEEPASKPQNDPPKKPQEPPAEVIERAREYLSEADSLDDLKTRWGRIPAEVKTLAPVIAAKDAAKDKLTKPILDDEIPY